MFGDPEKKKQKKIHRIAMKAAGALGIGIGLWFLSALYPYQEGAENTAKIFGSVSFALMFYGVAMLLTIVFRRDWIFKINFILSWLVLPAMLVFLLI